MFLARRGLSTAVNAVYQVERREGALLALQPRTLADTDRAQPGTVLRLRKIVTKVPDARSKVNEVVVLCRAGGGSTIAVQLDPSKKWRELESSEENIKWTTCPTEPGASIEPGDLLEVSSVDQEEVFNRMFRSPPRDMDRRVISKGWYTGVSSIDALSPIGIGQSMVLFDPKPPFPRYARKSGRSVLSGILYGITNAYKDVEVFVSEPRAQEVAPQVGTSKELGDTEKVKEGADIDVAPEMVLRTLVTLSKAEDVRSQGKDSVFALRDLWAFKELWERAQRLSGRSTSDDRSELRGYYSSLLVQRASQSATTGSLTVLLRVRPALIKPEKKKKKIVTEPLRDTFELKDFNGKDLARLEALLNAKPQVRLTREVLRAMSINVPISSQGFDSSAMHEEELKSLSDGQIQLAAPGGMFCIDPKSSMTRIGAGSLKGNTVRDVRSPLLASCAGGLRIEIVEKASNLEHFDASGKIGAEIALMRDILKYPPRMSNEKELACRLWAAKHERKVKADADFSSLRLELPANEQLDVLRACCTS